MRMGMGMGLGLGNTGGTVNPYTAEATAYFAAMTAQPTTAQKVSIDNRIRAIKAVSGLWAKLVGLWFFDIHDGTAALLNVITPGTYNCVNSGGMTFSAYTGYAGASTHYLNTQLNPTSNATISIDTLHIGVWVSSVPDTTAYLIGGVESTTIIGLRRAVPGTVYPSCMLNSTVGNARQTTNGTVSGHLVATRTDASTVVTIYQNGSALTISTATQAKAAAEINGVIHVGNVAGGNWANTGITKIAHIGTNLLDADVLALYNAINNNPITA